MKSFVCKVSLISLFFVALSTATPGLVKRQDSSLLPPVCAPPVICHKDNEVSPTQIPPILEGEESCGCDKSLFLLCGLDGNTYGNACLLTCAGVELHYYGECKTPCPCSKEFQPVCAASGHTYGNQCVLECNDGELDHEGPC